MFVIVTYDVNSKKCNKVMKVCRKYLYHLQNSVFMGELSESLINKFKKELLKLDVFEDGSIIFFINESYKSTKIDNLGLDILPSFFL